MCFSVASPKLSRLSRCTLLASLLQWERHPDQLEYGQLRLLTSEKDTNLRPVVQKTHKIFTRELVSINEVKIPKDDLVIKGLSFLLTLEKQENKKDF